jgi:hypothetical protein
MFGAATPVRMCPSISPFSLPPTVSPWDLRALSLKLTAVLDPTCGGCCKIWSGSSPSKIISAAGSTSSSEQSGPCVVCHGKLFSVWHFVFLPQVGGPSTDLNRDFVSSSTAFLQSRCISTRGELFYLYSVLSNIYIYTLSCVLVTCRRGLDW